MKLPLFLIASICLCTALVAATQRNTPETASIEGTVVSADSGAPIAGARISVRPRFVIDPNGAIQNPPPNSTMSGRDGRFELSGLDPGSVTLAVNPNPVEPSTQTFTVSAGQHLRDVRLRWSEPGVVYGRILDSRGAPVARANVWPYQLGFRLDGSRFLRPGRVASTDDRGMYRVIDLVPGQYILRITAPAQSFDPGNPQPPSRERATQNGSVIYPGVASVSDAIPLNVRTGEKVRAQNVVLPPTGLGWIRIHILNETGMARPNSWSISTTATGWDDQSPPQAELGTSTADTMDFRTDISGIYHVAAGWNTLLGIAQGYATFELGKLDVDIDLHVSPIALSQPRGRVLLEQTNGDPPQPLGGLSIYTYIPGSPSGMCITTRQDGTFAYRDCWEIDPDYYRVGYRVMGVNGLPKDSYVSEIHQGDRAVLSSDADPIIRSGGPDVEVIVRPDGGVLHARVSDRDGHTVHSALVALIPESPLSNRSDRLDTHRVGRADQNGEVTLHGVIPGNYRAYAWAGSEDGAALNPEFMKQFESQDVPRVQIANGSQLTVDLRLQKLSLRSR